MKIPYGHLAVFSLITGNNHKTCESLHVLYNTLKHEDTNYSCPDTIQAKSL